MELSKNNYVTFNLFKLATAINLQIQTVYNRSMQFNDVIAITFIHNLEIEKRVEMESILDKEYYDSIYFDALSTHSDKQTLIEEVARFFRKLGTRLHNHWIAFLNHPIFEREG